MNLPVVSSLPLLKPVFGAVAMVLFVSSSVRAQDWTSAQERELRWSALEFMMDATDSYRQAAKLDPKKRDQFKKLFTSPNSAHVLDIPGTPGLIFDEDLTVGEYVEIAGQLLKDDKLLITPDVIWVSSSKKTSNTSRVLTLTLSKKIKWYPPDQTNALEWTILLDVELLATLRSEGEVADIKIESVSLLDGKQAYVQVKTILTQKPIPFRKDTSGFTLTESDNALARDENGQSLLLLRTNERCFGTEDSDIILLSQEKCLDLPKASKRAYVKNPSLLSLQETITGVKYYGRFTAGLAYAQGINQGMYKAAPVSEFNSIWSPGIRLAFSAPIPKTKWDWTVYGGVQSSRSDVSFDAAQSIQTAIDPDDMEYNRITNITSGRETINTSVWMFGLGSTRHLGEHLFLKAGLCGTALQSEYEANASVQQSGYYRQLYGITIDESGIYDFGYYTTNKSSSYNNRFGWLTEAAIGFQIEYGAEEWGDARPQFYLSTGLRHHGGRAIETPLSWIQGTSDLNGALDTFGESAFQTFFVEVAFDIRKRNPPNNKD